jgi:hypothetical protein
MDVRDAVEADAAARAAIADAPVDVMRNLVHDRTVRVAEAGQGDGDPNVDVGVGADADVSEDRQLVGFVSYDAREGTVHVTQIEGATRAVERLLTEPIGFARGEGMTVELLLPEDDEHTHDTLTEVGFNVVGDGPRFEGTPTTRYRLEP